MTEVPTPLFAADLQAFMEIVANDDPEVRVNSLHTFDDMAVCEMLRYGISHDGTQVPDLMRFYEEYFMLAPLPRRQQIYRDLVEIVCWLGGNTVGALQPFMFMDTDREIVSRATVDYVSIGTRMDDDPMSRPRDVINMVTHGVGSLPGAIMGGLLILGDPRVCKLVEPLRREWDDEQAKAVSVCFSGQTAKCVVEFYLDWLDELIERDDWVGQSTLGHVLAGLCRLVGQRQVPLISDGLRPFPYDPDEAQASTSWIDPDEFASSIADRLYDLERREAAPKGMPHAIVAFGLVPKTQPSDWVDLDLPWGSPLTQN
jgi:hypothetical protein